MSVTYILPSACYICVDVTFMSSRMDLPITIRRSSRATRIRLQIETHNEPQLIVVAPRYALDFQIQQFIGRQTVWIEKHWKKALQTSQRRPKPQHREGDTYFYFGEPLRLVLLPSVQSKPRARAMDGQLQISLHQAIPLPESKKVIKNVIQDFYKKKASEVIHDRLGFFNEHYHFTYHRVTFRNQKTRWGSCSQAKNLNFNWRLIMAPIEIIDYVVIHELCHLRYMNHSPSFWNLVAQMAPDYKAHRKWLKENHYLLSFG